MKIKHLCLIAVLLLTFPTQSWALKVNKNTYFERQTTFNNITDFFATVGKSGKEKQKVLKDRKKARMLYRQDKQKYYEKKELKKKMDKQAEDILKKNNN